MTATLYASVLQLDRQAVKALRITDVYSLHRVVYSLFDDVRNEAQKNADHSSGIQWVDQGGDAFGRRLLLLSDRLPAAQVDGQYGEVRSKAIAPGFLEHSCYRFKIVVCPTRRDSASRKLVPVKGREAIAAWFAERAQASWGFSVDPARLQIDKVQVQQFLDKQQRTVTVQQAHLSGVLSVRERERFQLSVASGIGRGRAFGCGLLQIVPLIENPFA